MAKGEQGACRLEPSGAGSADEVRAKVGVEAVEVPAPIEVGLEGYV
jgi:hypothetical protein